MKMKSTLSAMPIRCLCILQCLAAFVLASRAPLSPPETLAMAISHCRQGDFKLLMSEANEAIYIKCIASALELWSDDRGYDTAGVVKFLQEFNRPQEISVVVHYCNTVHRDSANPEQWAYNAYKCAVSGMIGGWLREYATKSNTIE